MTHEFFDPTPEQQNIVLVDAATLRKAEKLIESCEHCNEEGAEIPFNVIVDRVQADEADYDCGTGGGDIEPRGNVHFRVFPQQ
jgi:hypothetical protein